MELYGGQQHDYYIHLNILTIFCDYIIFHFLQPTLKYIFCDFVLILYLKHESEIQE